MSNKRIVSYDLYEAPSRSPETKYELSFKTADDWFYRYTALSEEEPFSFKHKRRPDMKISDDDITPQSVQTFVEDHADFELIGEKVIYRGGYPSE